jgi:hypothetical protein
MEHSQKCFVYPTLACNCPEGVCRIEKGKQDEKARQQQMIDLLIDFQLFLKGEGLINDYDWAYEEEAERFVTQCK